MFTNFSLPACAGFLALATGFTAPLQARADLTANAILKLELAHNNATSINTKRIEAAFSGLVWQDFGVQMDLGIGKHEQYTSTSPSATVHAYYQPQDNLAYGVFLSSEDRRPGNSYYYGVEVAYETPVIGLEAFLATREDISAETSGYRFGGDVTLPLQTAPWLSVKAGGTYDNGLPLERGYLYFGAAAEVSDGIELGATLGQTDLDATIIGVSATIRFGAGTPFDRRDSFARYPGY